MFTYPYLGSYYNYPYYNYGYGYPYYNYDYPYDYSYYGGYLPYAASSIVSPRASIIARSVVPAVTPIGSYIL